MIAFYSFIEIVASFLEQLFLLCLGGLFYERRIKSKFYWAWIFIISIVFTCFVTYLNNISIYSYATLAIGILLFVLALVSFNRCNVIQACCLSVLYMVIISSFDFLFLIFVEFVLKSPDFVMAVLGGKCLERLITLIISKGTLAIAFFTIKKKKWKVSIPITTALVLIVFAVVSFYSMQYLIEKFFLSEYEKTQEIILIAFAFMSLFFMSVILVLNGQEKMKRKVKENEHIESELRITQERNQELIETYGEIAKISHDFKNQMRVTLLMLKNGDLSEAQSYLSGIVDSASTSTLNYTGISSIDTVLSEKVRVATENDIKTELDINLSSLCGVDSIDVCTIMLNLIDNAVEACLKISDKSKRQIKIVLRNVNSMIFLKITNSVVEDSVLSDHNSVMKTTKKNKAFHGFGLKIVNSLVEKYNGSFMRENVNNSFVVTILLCK